jgi:septal ring-binding cell division protein DamX
MAKKRNREAREPKRGALDERRRLIAAGSLSTAVLIVLVFGAVLKTDAPFAETTVPVSEPTTTARVAEVPIPEPGESAREPLPVTSPPAVAEPDPDPPAPRRARPAGPLEERAATDRGRLIDSGGSYSLQLMVSCDPVNARRNLDRIGTTSRLYLLPLELEGRSCYRLCWGTYASRESAERASDLPPGFDAVRVQPVEELTR